MNNSVLDFLTEAIDNEKLFNKVSSAKTREELYELYKEFNSENSCDKDCFGKCIDELLEEYLPLENLDDSQIANVSGGVDNSKFNRVAASLLSALSITGGAVVPSMSAFETNSKRASNSVKNEQTQSFFERHPNLKKLAIGGGTVGTIALGATALYLMTSGNSKDSEKSDSTIEGSSQTVNSNRMNDEQTNIEVNSRIADYSDNYWPEKLGKNPLGNDLSKIDIHPPFVMLARSNGRNVAEIEPIDKSILDRIHFVKGDITKDVKVDCIVNAAMNSLGHGGGVCGGIFKAADSRKLSGEISTLKNDLKLNKIPNGSAVITGAHDIKTAKHIVHTPGPDMNENMNKPKNACLELASSYGASIELAAANSLNSIAFPSISTGIFKFPVEKASLIALYTVVQSLERHEDMNVYFVVFPGSAEESTYNEMMKALGKSYEKNN